VLLTHPPPDSSCGGGRGSPQLSFFAPLFSPILNAPQDISQVAFRVRKLLTPLKSPLEKGDNKNADTPDCRSFHSKP
jgi:hypothetical protein